MQDVRAYGHDRAGALAHHAYVLPPIVAFLPPGTGLRILDAGCGNGYTTQHLADLGHDVIGVDAAPDGIALAREAHPGLRFELASLYEPLEKWMPEGGWDAIVSPEVIEHLYDPRAYLVNLGRHLRPGGTLILTTPHHGYVKNLAIALAGGWDRHHLVDQVGGHIKFFSSGTLRAMLEGCGYRDVRFRFAGRLPLLWKSMICAARWPGPA